MKEREIKTRESERNIVLYLTAFNKILLHIPSAILQRYCVCALGPIEHLGISKLSKYSTYLMRSCKTCTRLYLL